MAQQNAELKEITSRLDLIIKLMAGLFVRDLKNNEAIVKLESMQLSREQIAGALGITTANVAQVIYASKQAEKKADKKPKKGGGEAILAGASTEIPSGAPEEA